MPPHARTRTLAPGARTGRRAHARRDTLASSGRRQHMRSTPDPGVAPDRVDIAVVDPDPLTREGIRAIISDEAPCTCGRTRRA